MLFTFSRNMLSVLLNAKIHVFQSDWGGEYRHLSRNLAAQGIQHRVTCPHTSQQNGIAERKHRHIVETGIALLAHSSLPIRFWDEAFLSACYLINRMPTRTLQRSTPIEILLNEKPITPFCAPLVAHAGRTCAPTTTISYPFVLRNVCSSVIALCTKGTNA